MSTFVVVGGYRGQLGSRLTEDLTHRNNMGVLGWDVRSGSGHWHAPGSASPCEIFDYDEALRSTDGRRLIGTVALSGKYRMAPFLDESPLSHQEAFSSNYFSVVNVLQRWLPHMIAGGGGSFLTVSTMGVAAPYGGATSYVAAKGAVLALTRALDLELHQEGVHGHCIVAGPMQEVSEPGMSGSVSYTTIVDAIRRLLIDPKSGVSYFPADGA